jgi:hypothetical protein
LRGLCTLYTFATPKTDSFEFKKTGDQKKTAHKPMKAQAWAMQADS